MKKIENFDRRFDYRHEGTGLAARIDGEEYDVVDVSVGGMKIVRPSGYILPHSKVSFTLISSLDAREISAVGMVRAMGANWVAIQFNRPTMRLMKVVSRHIGNLLVGRSYLFEK